MAYVPKMISLTPEDARWIAERKLNASGLMRDAIDICRETDNSDIRNVVEKLRLVNRKLNELLSAYQMDERVRTEDVR